MKHTLLLATIVALSLSMVSPVHAQLRKVKKDTYSYYEYGKKHIENSEISRFLKTNCPEAYNQYHNKHLKIGWGICVPSMAMVITGAVMSFTGKSDGIVYAGIGIGAAGAVGVLSSIPVLSIGYEKRRKTCSVFNQYCARNVSTTPLMLNFSVGAQSLGLAVNF